MKAIVSKTQLLNLIAKIQSIVSSKPAIPILANILIEAIDDQLVISATDLMVSMRAYTEAQILEEGAITLPAKKFFQLIRELTTAQVEIHSTAPDIAFINAGTSHFKIHGMHKSEFPSLPDLSEGVQLAIETSLLKEMLSRTVFAAAREDSRQIINGILFENIQNTATFIATDGKRIARLQTSIDMPMAQAGSFIVPVKAVEEIIKVLDINEKSCTMTLMHDKLALEIGPITLITKLLAGKYPDVASIIPKKGEQPIVLHREELITLLRQISLFTTEDSGAVRLTLTPGELHLAAMSGEIGEGKVNMPVNYAGSKMELAFNPHYFLDILRHCKDETVNLDVSDPFNPALITDSSSAQFALMPMRIEH